MCLPDIYLCTSPCTCIGSTYMPHSNPSRILIRKRLFFAHKLEHFILLVFLWACLFITYIMVYEDTVPWHYPTMSWGFLWPLEQDNKCTCMAVNVQGSDGGLVLRHWRQLWGELKSKKVAKFSRGVYRLHFLLLLLLVGSSILTHPQKVPCLHLSHHNDLRVNDYTALVWGDKMNWQ